MGLLMNRLRFQVLALLLMLPGIASAAATCSPLLDHRFKRLSGSETLSMCDYAGKVVLVVNTASFCGNTPQYEGLERLYQKYSGRGLVVVGFPSNDFGQQEPGSEKEIAEFCKMTYGVKFPMAAKTSVVGAAAHPFYRQLAKSTGAAPSWNFHKYLIDRSGNRVVSFDSGMQPESPAIVAKIESLLAAP